MPISNVGTARCCASNNNCGRGYPSTGSNGRSNGNSGGSQQPMIAVSGDIYVVNNEYCEPVKPSDQELANGAPPYQYRLIRSTQYEPGLFKINALISQYNELSKRYFDGSKSEHFLFDYVILQQLKAVETLLFQECEKNRGAVDYTDCSY